MRQNQNKNRARGRGRRPGNSSNRSFESNGPDVKIRGTASHIHDKYISLARDANVAGDRVAAENYLQHAEHYQRLMSAAQAAQQAQQKERQQAADDAEVAAAENGSRVEVPITNGSGKSSDGAEAGGSDGGQRSPEEKKSGDGSEVTMESSADAEGEAKPQRKRRTKRSKAEDADTEPSKPASEGAAA